MKKILLLIIIYLAFISLGLPDALLGSAWPDMYLDLDVPVHFAGIISMIIAAGTVISSLFSAHVINRFGVARVTTFSVLLTALALLGFSYSQHFIYLCFLAVPLGLGAGCVDAALNNYVALHYKAKHMNWLHCFWGIGAAVSPLIMSGYLARGESWTAGYNTVGWIQACLVILLFLSMPLWITASQEHAENKSAAEKSFRHLLGLKGLKQALIVFFCYCAVEATFGLWGASYLVLERNFTADEAAKFVAIYYGGITLGRLASGFLTQSLNNRQLVYIGQAIILLGIITIFLPFNTTLLLGFSLVGLGCAPIFPSLLHETPRNFGEKHSQTVIGMQMASAYIGITLMPLFFGQLASFLSHGFLLWFIAILSAIQIYANLDMNKKVSVGR